MHILRLRLIWPLLLAIGLAYLLFIQYQLPTVSAMTDFSLQVPMRIYSADGVLIATVGDENRMPIPIDQVPKQVINAFLATEDSRFYQHHGVDWLGMGRAIWVLLTTGHKSQGGSTITMQVARNFFLSPEKSYLRKVKEILLAWEIEKKLSKSDILELYLNKIYFGEHAYGLAAAAKVYYGKNVSALSLAEAAMLAGLPEAPSALNPLRHPQAALNRRQHVLERMFKLHIIDESTYLTVSHSPNTASRNNLQSLQPLLEAPYVADEVQKLISQTYGSQALLSGLIVTTTIDSHLQQAATKQITKGLLDYTQRHEWHGILAHAELDSNWDEELGNWPPGLIPAQLIAKESDRLIFLSTEAKRFVISPAGYAWTKVPFDHWQIGDIVWLRTDRYEASIGQQPDTEAALLSMQVRTGAVLALVGGYDYHQSQFDRVTQALRQPGSNFKPFVYAAAIAAGMTPETLINDAPIIEVDPHEEQWWRPHNDNDKFNGPTTLANGLIYSRNLVSIRLLQQIGLAYARQFLTKFGFAQADLPRGYSLVLGTNQTTMWQLATAYSTLASLGNYHSPYLIDHIEQQIFPNQPITSWFSATDKQCGDKKPSLPCSALDHGNQTIDPRVAYIINSILQKAIQSGTGRGALVLHRPDLAGKTGTTNQQVDAWYTGYNADLLTSVWVGKDNPSSLGEFGSQAALPIWIGWMAEVLPSWPITNWPEPAGLIRRKTASGNFDWLFDQQVNTKSKHTPAAEPDFIESNPIYD